MTADGSGLQGTEKQCCSSPAAQLAGWSTAQHRHSVIPFSSASVQHCITSPRPKELPSPAQPLWEECWIPYRTSLCSGLRFPTPSPALRQDTILQNKPLQLRQVCLQALKALPAHSSPAGPMALFRSQSLKEKDETGETALHQQAACCRLCSSHHQLEGIIGFTAACLFASLRGKITVWELLLVSTWR